MRVDRDCSLYSIIPYPDKTEDNTLVIRGRVLGVVSSSDRASKKDTEILSVIFADEIRELNEAYGVKDWE